MVQRKSKKQERIENDYGKLIILFVCLIMANVMLAMMALRQPLVTVEYKNQSCDCGKFLGPDTSLYTNNNKNATLSVSDIWKKINENKTCYSIPAPAQCEYVKLKNGTLIPTGICSVTFNYVLKCINNSEVEGKVFQ